MPTSLVNTIIDEILINYIDENTEIHNFFQSHNQ